MSDSDTNYPASTGSAKEADKVSLYKGLKEFFGFYLPLALLATFIVLVTFPIIFVNFITISPLVVLATLTITMLGSLIVGLGFRQHASQEADLKEAPIPNSQKKLNAVKPYSNYSRSLFEPPLPSKNVPQQARGWIIESEGKITDLMEQALKDAQSSCPEANLSEFLKVSIKAYVAATSQSIESIAALGLKSRFDKHYQPSVDSGAGHDSPQQG
jgi:hypothetical protein